MQENIIEKNEEQPALKIGELLVKEGLVKKEHVENALEIQKKEIEEAKLPLGMLLIKNGLVSEDQLQRLLDHPYLRKRIGDLAIEKGLIDEKQLHECLKKAKPSELIGQALIREAYITAADLNDLVIRQMDGTQLGQLALKSDMITEKDLDEILARKKFQRTVGEILCDLNYVDPVDLKRILQKYNKQQKLGDILIKQGIITERQLKEALFEQKHRAEYLGNILIEMKFVTQEELYTALSKQYNIEFKKLNQFDLSRSQINTLSAIIGQNYAETNRILPLSSEGNQLMLAVSDVDNLHVVNELSSLYSHRNINCVLITEEKFKGIFETLYGTPLKSLQKAEKTKQSESNEGIVIDLDEESEARGLKSDIYGIADRKVQEVVNDIIRYGISKNASDIHIEQDRKETRLRYRIDGMLHTLKTEWLDQSLRDMAGAIISRIKVMSDLDIAERRLPQDGAFRLSHLDKANNKKINLDFRVAVCPAVVGENIVIRILDPRKAKVGLEHLGLSQHALKPFKELLMSSAGMLILSGPTGSGKTSTLYGALEHISNPAIKIITAEDPIEYSIPGIMQVQVGGGPRNLDNRISSDIAGVERS